MTQKLDISGLPAETIEEIRQFIEHKRASLTRRGTLAIEDVDSLAPEQLTTLQWLGRFHAMQLNLKRKNVILDDSRESIYEGCGE